MCFYRVEKEAPQRDFVALPANGTEQAELNAATCDLSYTKQHDFIKYCSLVQGINSVSVACICAYISLRK